MDYRDAPDGRGPYECFLAASRLSDVALAQRFNKYRATMPSRLTLNEAKEPDLLPCSVPDVMMLLVLGLRLANRQKNHAALEPVRKSFESNHEAFEIFHDAETEEVPGLGVLRQAFGDFKERSERLRADMLVNMPSSPSFAGAARPN